MKKYMLHQQLAAAAAGAATTITPI